MTSSRIKASDVMLSFYFDQKKLKLLGNELSMCINQVYEAAQ